MIENVGWEVEIVIFLFTVTQTELSWPELTQRHVSSSAAIKYNK